MQLVLSRNGRCWQTSCGSGWPAQPPSASQASDRQVPASRLSRKPAALPNSANPARAFLREPQASNRRGPPTTSCNGASFTLSPACSSEGDTDTAVRLWFPPSRAPSCASLPDRLGCVASQSSDCAFVLQLPPANRALKIFTNLSVQVPAGLTSSSEVDPTPTPTPGGSMDSSSDVAWEALLHSDHHT